MKIRHWLNGKCVNETTLDVARWVASFLRAHGWEVLEVYEVGMLVVFSPDFAR